MAFGPAKLNGDVLAIDVASLFQTNAKARDIVRKRLRRGTVKKPNHRHRRLLRAHRERPASRRATEQCGQEFSSSDVACHVTLLSGVIHVLDIDSLQARFIPGSAENF